MNKRIRKTRAQAQALVEFALAATIIFFLLAAVVDLGLIYFTMQALRVAAQEGASYGSYPKVEVVNGAIRTVDFNYSQIAYRIYGSAGDQSNGIANMHDLNSNGRDDLNVDFLHDDVRNPTSYIYIQNLKGIDPNNFPQPTVPCRGDIGGVELQNGGISMGSTYCWIKVTVSYNYRFLFPLAPAFQDTVRLSASQLMPVRSTFYTGN